VLTLMLNLAQVADPVVLYLGAHSDDIEIGCGGTTLRLIEEYPHLRVYWVVFSATPARAVEAVSSAEKFLAGVSDRQIIVKEFPDGFFPYVGAEIKRYFEELKQIVSPALIFTHYREDRHQDHRILNELTWSTFRNHFILEYEIPKYDGDLGSPNLFVPLDEAIFQKKIGYLLRYFVTQSDRQWFTAETFGSLLRLRGIESKAKGGFAEAFYCRKIILL
jgi:LmbE family N-acetylglucosaminyl deacetylase